jgi:monofunctional biosynthetic peptidoglycan transglycosylase
LDKTRILERYLNLVEWGDGVFGIEVAARHDFGVSAAQLNPWQAAWLASILPAPKRYDRNRQSQWIERKAGVILRRMPLVSLP